ncbi:MAG: metallophosphoesterase [Patescibacteria group bacterium]|nr:metallophosphoesterase [Patescibacteria group bacterium]MDE2015599.1 metallophosphoesterase [Patescibacteria group bacterium]MDE2226656.1 metallophosphoesterase [Patescibacteria group bacterium]
MHRRIPKFTVFILVIQVLLLYLHWFIYYTIIIFLHIEIPSTVFILRAIFSFLSVSFILSSVLAFRYVDSFISRFYSLAAAWMGFFFYLFIASFLSWIGFVVSPNLAPQFVIVFFTAACAVSVYGLINANRIRVTEITVPLKNLPPSWKSRTAVFLSDLHLGQIRREKFTARVANAINSLNPDIVFIGGDFYDGVQAEVKKITRPFYEVKPPMGVWFVAGNHDEFRDTGEYFTELRNAGVRILDNEMVLVDGIQLIGVDYGSTELKRDYREVMNGLKIDREKPSILLRHVPNLTIVPRQAGVSFQLSGHTHNAQVFPVMLLTELIFRGRNYGLKKRHNFLSYTSSGVGTWGPPLRVGTKSEIVKISFIEAD